MQVKADEGRKFPASCPHEDVVSARKQPQYWQVRVGEDTSTVSRISSYLAWHLGETTPWLALLIVVRLVIDPLYTLVVESIVGKVESDTENPVCPNYYCLSHGEKLEVKA